MSIEELNFSPYSFSTQHHPSAVGVCVHVITCARGNARCRMRKSRVAYFTTNILDKLLLSKFGATEFNK
jgi:hypothetical protein